MHSSYFGKNRVEEKKKNKISFEGLYPQFELNEMEADFHQAILKQQADDNPFSINRKSGLTIVKVNHVRATMEEAQNFKEMMLAMIYKGHRKFIIDLTTCNFLDSTFLGAIILVTKKNMNNNGSLVLVAECKKLKVLYALKELSKILTVYETLDDAINKSNK